MRPRDQERGGAGALLFWLVLLGLFVYLAAKFAPPYVTSNEFADQMDSIARDSGAGNYSDEQARALLMRKAKDLNIPLKESDIKIKHTGGEVIIEVKYTLEIDLPFINSYLWKFSPRVSKPILT